MSKVDGVPCRPCGSDMEDGRCDEVMHQIIDVILDLSQQRFDKIGALVKGDGIGKDACIYDYIAHLGSQSCDSIPIESHRIQHTQLHRSTGSHKQMH